MEDLLSYIFAHSDQVVLIVTALLLLAGLNVPISEDILLIGCGAIVCDALILTQLAFYGWLFIVCWVSAWEAYALGRALGPRRHDDRLHPFEDRSLELIGNRPLLVNPDRHQRETA